MSTPSSKQDEKLFSDTMVESMPGILYFYDSDGRFLRWNRNFEIVSGYSHGEIARMRPLDFFSAEDRALVESRIQEVFRSGESCVEAPFLSKSGLRTPYFFTGRRVTFEGRECLAGVGIDISDRVRAEERNAMSMARFPRSSASAPTSQHAGAPKRSCARARRTWSRPSASRR